MTEVARCIEPACDAPSLKGPRCQPHYLAMRATADRWQSKPKTEVVAERDRQRWEDVRGAVLERDGDVCACGRAALSAIYSRPYQPSLRLDVSALAATCPRCWPRRMPTNTVGVIGSKRESAK